VTWAVQSFPGEVSERAYEDGLDYNSAIAARREQQALGWSAQVRQGAAPGQVAASFLDAEGEPLRALQVHAVLRRPATDRGAAEFRLEPTSEGGFAGAARIEA